MARLQSKVERRKKVQVEYILGLYATQTGHPINMTEYLDASVDDVPSQVNRDGTPLFTARIFKRDVNLVVDVVEFPINSQQFSVMKGLMNLAGDKRVENEDMPYTDKEGNLLPVAPNHPVGKKTVRFDADPRFQIKCDVEAKQIPGLLMNRGLRGVLNSESKPQTLALQCKCPKGYFCDKIKNIIASGNDISHWGSKVRSGVGSDKPVLFCIAVPIMDYILFSVPIESSIRQDWDDNAIHKLMTYGMTEDVTMFYDFPTRYPNPNPGFMMLQDQITNINKEIADATEAGFPTSTTSCSSRKHTYGATRKVQEFINTRPDAQNITIACFYLYGICPACYVNANPVFSLLTDPL